MRRPVLLILLLMAGACATHPGEPLENVHELAPGVLAGGGPHGDPAFRELARRGVRTVISVDGARPDVERARRHGLRYVHLPIGYDGIPVERALQLGKAMSEVPGPVYVHCHHGKHRGPAAAAVACVVAGKLDAAQAVEVLRKMGTGDEYLGLWSSVREANAADRDLLRAVDVTYREVAPVPPLAEAMVALDGVVENLERARGANWKAPPGRPDVDPAHEALRAREIFTEIQRTDDPARRSADYTSRMQAGLNAATALESALRVADAESASAGLAALRRSCTGCHRSYRNASGPK